MREANIICAEMKHYIGTGFRPCEPYIAHMFHEILTEWRDPNPDDITDYGGNFPVPIKMKKFDNIFKTIEYIIFPEVFTEYIMKMNKVTYKGDSRLLSTDYLLKRAQIILSSGLCSTETSCL